MAQIGPAGPDSVAFDAIIVGCGTIGAAIGVALASSGLNIALYDSDPLRHREALDNHASVCGEPDMVQAMLCATAAKRLHFIDRLECRRFPTHYIVCVPTPVSEGGELDAGALDCAMEAIIEIARPDDAIFIRSTVPIGTTRRLAAAVRARGLDLRFAATPDRSIEGRSFADQFSIPQLIGGVDRQAAARAATLFARLGQAIDLGCAEAAEAAKLFVNAWRFTMFAASNAMALACESHGLDVHAIFAAASANYPRFSPPRPGPVGGPCLPKDVSLLAASMPAEARSLLRGVTQSETHLFAQIVAALDAHLAAWPGPLRIALAGVAFKGRPAVRDTRGSTALLLAQHFRVRWPDSVLVGWDAVMTAGEIENTGLIPAASLWDAAHGASLAVFCNDHPASAQFDLQRLARTVARGALIYDLVGITTPICSALPNEAQHHIFGRAK